MLRAQKTLLCFINKRPLKRPLESWKFNKRYGRLLEELILYLENKISDNI